MIMRKRAILLLLALLSVLNCFASYVYDTVYVSTISYKILSESDKTVAVTSPPSYYRINDTIRIFEYGGDIVIPSTVVIDSIEYRVTEIANGVFSYCAKLTSVTIPNGVTKIGEQAFSSCNITSMIIPGSIISIGNYAFLYCRELKSITIEEGVTIIGDHTFNDCTELTSVTIPESVTKIGDYAFLGCSNLNTITIPKSVSSIGTMAFNECDLDSIIVDPENPIYDSRGDCNALIETASNTLLTGCRNTVIPESVTTISRAAFFRCYSLTSITIPESITTIGDWAFCFCYGLTSIFIPENVVNIGLSIVAQCTNLTSITIDSNNKCFNRFGDCNAIIDSTGLLLAGCKNTVIPSGVTAIGVDAFGGCDIESIIFPDGVTRIASRAFYDCKNLSTVEMPSSLSIIKDEAFRFCTSLSSIIIPRNISFIGPGAFQDCSGLTSVTILSETYAFEESYYYPEPFKGINYDSCSLYVPDGCYLAYRKNSYFSPFYRSLNNVHILKNPDCITIDGINYCIVSDVDKTVRVVYNDYSGNIVIPTSITIDEIDYSVVSISNEAFFNCGQLTSVVINDGVANIGEYAFYGCERLESVILPASVKVIGDRAFSGCKSLMSFIIPQGLEELGNYVFEGCSALSAVSIPQGFRIIGDGMFAGCSNIKHIDIPSSVGYIGGGAFQGCSNIKHIDIPSSVDYIGGGAFQGCSLLDTIIIPNGIEFIGVGTFEDCSSLTFISIPSSVNSIGSYAFSGCKSLESLIIPDGVNTIYYKTFSGCQSLSYLSLPASVKSFEKKVFDDCYALKSAGPKGGGYNFEFSWTDTIPGNAFNGMKSLRSVYIPKSVELITDQGLEYTDITIIDDNGVTHSFFKALYFEGCDSLESLAISFTDTKIIKGHSKYSPYRYQDYADYNLFIGTPIHSIAFLDDTIKSIYNFELAKIDEVVISGYVKEANPKFFNQMKYLKKIDVYTGNDNYTSQNGVLYSRFGNELITYPSAREGKNYQIPERVRRIADYAFSGTKNLQSVVIPELVSYVGTNAFDDCKSLKTVTIKGAPQINYNAFNNCPNIEAVYSYSGRPENMMVLDTPQAIVVDGSDVVIDNGNQYCNLIIIGTDINYYRIFENYNTGDWTFGQHKPAWTFNFVTDKLPAGKYKMSIGLLPNLTDGMPNYFHPIVKGITDSTDVVLYERIDDVKIDFHGRIRIVAEPQYIINDMSGYDSVLVADTLIIPEGYDSIKVLLISGVNDRNWERFSSELWLDGIFFEPLDDMPIERYAGPFVEGVFNNATLYIPQIAVDAYHEADGWKLFKNIAFDPDIDAGIDHIKNGKDNDIIYDLMGRRVKSRSLEQLEPGIYIINGTKYLVK